MKTIKNVPLSTLSSETAEQAFMLISGIGDRADYSDRISFPLMRQWITSQLNTRVDAIEALLEELNSDDGSGLAICPIGMISMWYGSEGAVPAGWAICNGQSVNRSDGAGTIATPDLRNRTVVGAGTTLAVGATAGSESGSVVTTSAAGAHTHTLDGGGHFHQLNIEGTALTVDQIPAHKHGNGVLDDGTKMFNHGYFYGGSTADSIDNDGSSGHNEGWTTDVGGGQAHTHAASLAGAGDHGHGVSSSGEHTHTATLSTMQPSMGLHYIMKV